MTYATRADLEARFGPIEIGDLDDQTDRVTPVLEDATAEIDGALAAAYDLPLPAGEYPLLKAICVDLARARLYDTAPLEEPKKRRDSARTKLKQLCEGKLQLVNADGVVIERRHRPQVSGPALVMTRANLAGL